MKLLFSALFFLSLAVHGQTYPSKPVKLIVPFPAGSATDQVARVVGAELQQALRQPFVIENKAGAQAPLPRARSRKQRPTATR